MTPEKWKDFTIGDILTLQYGKGLPKRSRNNGLFPVIGSGGIIGYHDEFFINGPGIIVGRKGSIGTVYFEKQNFWPIDTVFYVELKSLDFDMKFIYYLLLRSNLRELNTDAAVPGLNRNVAHSQKCHIPPIITQRKIAAILSAYDDLIEKNTRRIKILEEMAEAIFREWFVYYHFPGYENVRFIDSGTELGNIPEGWKVKKVGEAFQTIGGGTPSTTKPEYWENGDINWFSPSDLTASGAMFIKSSTKKITKLGLKNSSATIFPPYSVMMTSRATIGVVSINTTPACTNQGFITCIPNENISTYQIYFWILENLAKIDNVASGATYKEINRTEFRDFDFIVADKNTKKRLDEILLPIGKQIEVLLQKNINLCETRDLLLPKLVSGELDVSEVEISGIE